MKIIKQIKNEEIGGFHNLEIIAIEDILFCPIILTNLNASNLDYKKYNDSDVEIMPVGETITINANPKRTVNGIEYSVKGQFEVKYLETDVDDVFSEAVSKRIIVKANRYNGTSIIYGSQSHPLYINYKIKNSKKFETKSKFEITITGKIPQKPVFIGV